MTSVATDGDRLRRLLGGPELAWLVAGLRRRLERGRPLTGAMLRRPASDAERTAVARLLGRRLRPGDSVSVPLADLEAVLRRAGAAPDLQRAVEALTGPVSDLAHARAEQEDAWTRVLTEAQAWADRLDLGGWLQDLRATGLLRRLAGDPDAGRGLLQQARQVLEALPATGVPRARLAGDVLGDSHGLDDDRALATLVLRAAATFGDAGASTATGAAWRREVWAGVGVLVGELSAPVLTLGLTATGSSPTSGIAAITREAGEPLHLTLRQLVRDRPPWTPRVVWVCENPTVVAVAADHLGARCPPLVCGSGQPTAAVTTLLRQLVAAGAELRYHGDFDWPGLVIANGLVERLGVVPWRLRTADYVAASGRSRRLLEGNPVEAGWDRELASAMARHGVRVEEELVLDDLLTDLSGHQQPTGSSLPAEVILGHRDADRR